MFGRENWERNGLGAFKVRLTYAETCTYLLDPNGPMIAYHHAVRATLGWEP